MSAGAAWNPVGQVIGNRYEVVDVIARGGQGIVCRARDNKTGKDVAIKALSDFASADPQMAERFKREQQVLVELEGTNAVKLLDTVTSPEGALCLVMELLDGVDLEQYLELLESEEKRMPLERVIEVLDPIVETLTRAHKAGIFHRDLKPANIFLLSERAGGGVRLLDFGFARLRSARPLTAIGTVMGSPSYIAPEVWKGQPHLIDQRTDVYSLAVIIFRMLTGRPPFESKSLVEMLAFATSAQRPSLHALRPDLPADVDDWTFQALAVDPNERFRTVRALYQSLLDVIGMERPQPKSAGGLVSAWRAARDAVRRLAGGVGKSDRPKPAPSAAPAPAGSVSPARIVSVSSAGSDATQGKSAPSAMPKLPPPPRRPPPHLPPPPPPSAVAAAARSAAPAPVVSATTETVSMDAVTLLRIPPSALTPSPAIAPPQAAERPAVVEEPRTADGLVAATPAAPKTRTRPGKTQPGKTQPGKTQPGKTQSGKTQPGTRTSGAKSSKQKNKGKRGKKKKR